MHEFLEFVAEIMEIDSSELNEDTEIGKNEKWDSLMHMRLVMEIEERYNIEIPFDKVSSIKKLKDFYKYICA